MSPDPELAAKDTGHRLDPAKTKRRSKFGLERRLFRIRTGGGENSYRVASTVSDFLGERQLETEREGVSQKTQLKKQGGVDLTDICKIQFLTAGTRRLVLLGGGQARARRQERFQPVGPRGDLSILSTLRRRPRDEYVAQSTARHARRRAGRLQLGRLEGGARARARVAEERGLVLLAQRGDELRG